MNEKKISGIICHVQDCEYHTKDNSCVAGSIKVGSCVSCSGTDAQCDTYKAKQYLLNKYPANAGYFFINQDSLIQRLPYPAFHKDF